MKKVLILGGAGFIGSHLCLKLVEKGYNVSVLDSLNKQVHGEEYTNSFLYQMIQGKVDLHIAKMQDEKLLLALLRENDIVVHLASETGTAQSMYRVKQYTEVNIGSISTLLDTLINNETRVKKVFLASSRAVYGEGRYQNEHGQAIFPNIRNKGDLENGQFDLLSKENRKRLTMRPNTENCQINPISVYGFSKYAQEQLLKITAQTYGIDFCVLRFQNVFGPGQSLLNSYTGVLNVFASRAILNKPLDIFEDGLRGTFLM
jgi:dTDP-L-rhamnose 4-epimerase